MKVVTWEPGGVFATVDHLGYDHISATIVHGSVFDADLDGDADRVRVTHNFFDGDFLSLDLFERDAGGTWVATIQSMSLSFLPQALVRMDCDGDAYLDLYLHDGTSGTFVSLANGTLQPPGHVPAWHLVAVRIHVDQLGRGSAQPARLERPARRPRAPVERVAVHVEEHQVLGRGVLRRQR